MNIDLPRYVVMAERRTQGGIKYDFYFKVPARLRPDGWLPSIRLPVEESKRTRDASPAELAAVIADGLKYNQRLDAARNAAQPMMHREGSPPWLMDKWRASPEWPDKKKTAIYYEQGWRHIEKWSEKNDHKSVAGLKWPRIVTFIKRFDDTPATQRQVRITLKRLLDFAVDEGVIERNPFAGHERRRWRVKQSDYTVEVWDWPHVRTAVKAFLKAKRRSLAVATLIGYELMQYPQQIAGFRRGEHYDPKTGIFTFNRNKTGVPCCVKVSRATQWFLRNCDLYLVVSEETGRPYSEGVLAKSFRRVLSGHDTLKTFEMRWLRHSGVFEARRAGLDMDQIADIGAWKSTGAVQAVIDRHYRVPDGELASAGQDKRLAYRNAERTKSFTRRKK